MLSRHQKAKVADILGIKLSEAFKILLEEKNQNNSELILNSYLDLYNRSQNKVKLFDGVGILVLKSYIDVDIRLQLQLVEEGII
jgi:hypothetical protein